MKPLPPDRWARISELYHHALELPPAEVPAYLAAQCGPDAELRAKVEELLREADETHSLVALPMVAPSGLAPGAHLGHYEILAKLGEGGMGVVYKAVDRRLGRTVALKVLLLHHATEQDRHRFAREAQAASALHHPNIVTIYEYNTDFAQDFIAMEYVEGMTLAKVLEKKSAHFAQLLDYARQTAAALAKAHAAGIVHRDLKPGNIMVTPEGVVKVLDFGIAKQTTLVPHEDDATVTLALTQVGAVLGTPAYMSPEQAIGEPVDARSDIFSFGVLLYEITAGRRPFQGKNAQATLNQVATLQPAPVREARPTSPRTLGTLIGQCLEKSREQRLQSMQEAAEQLGGIIQGLDRPPASRRWWLLLLALLPVAWYFRPAPELRTLTYAIESDPPSANGVYRGGGKFRLRLTSPQSGHLYLLSDGPDQTGTPRLFVLQPGSRPKPNETTVTGWFVFDQNPGTERLWLVWAGEPVPELDQAVRVAVRARLDDPPLTQTLRTLLAAWRPAITTREAGAWGIRLRTAAPVLAEAVELQHQ
ncbi:MAG: protein kinase [Bryobacteraceae bacterium]|nr:protein kinase [Bryobacteraceae bacterium]